MDKINSTLDNRTGASGAPQAGTKPQGSTTSRNGGKAGRTALLVAACAVAVAVIILAIIV